MLSIITVPCHLDAPLKPQGMGIKPMLKLYPMRFWSRSQRQNDLSVFQSITRKCFLRKGGGKTLLAEAQKAFLKLFMKRAEYVLY